MGLTAATGVKPVTLPEQWGLEERSTVAQQTLVNTGIAYDGTDYYVSNIFDNTISVFGPTGAYLHDITLQTGGYPTLVEDLSVNYNAVFELPNLRPGR